MGKILNKSTKEWTLKDLATMRKHLKNAQNFKFTDNQFNLKKDQALNKRLNNYIGLSIAITEILEKRIKEND